MGWGQENLYDLHADHYEDAMVALLYGNHLPYDATHRVTSQRKTEIMQDIFDKGFYYDIQSDNDFTYS